MTHYVQWYFVHFLYAIHAQMAYVPTHFSTEAYTIQTTVTAVHGHKLQTWQGSLCQVCISVAMTAVTVAANWLAPCKSKWHCKTMNWGVPGIIVTRKAIVEYWCIKYRYKYFLSVFYCHLWGPRPSFNKDRQQQCEAAHAGRMSPNIYHRDAETRARRRLSKTALPDFTPSLRQNWREAAKIEK